MMASPPYEPEYLYARTMPAITLYSYRVRDEFTRNRPVVVTQTFAPL